MNNKIVPCKLLFIYSVFYETKGENRFLQGSSLIELHCEVSFYGASRLALLSLVSHIYDDWNEEEELWQGLSLTVVLANFLNLCFALLFSLSKGGKKIQCLISSAVMSSV